MNSSNDIFHDVKWWFFAYGLRLSLYGVTNTHKLSGNPQAKNIQSRTTPYSLIWYWLLLGVGFQQVQKKIYRFISIAMQLSQQAIHDLESVITIMIIKLNRNMPYYFRSQGHFPKIFVTILIFSKNLNLNFKMWTWPATN